MHIKVLKQASNHGSVLKKVHRVFQFNQEDWLKPYIDMNTKKKRFFGKTMENVRKHRGIKLVTTDEKRNKSVSEPNYHTTKRFSISSYT